MKMRKQKGSVVNIALILYIRVGQSFLFSYHPIAVTSGIRSAGYEVIYKSVNILFKIFKH